MTPKMLGMSKEQLVNAIAKCDELGKKLEKSIKKTTEARDELLIRADAMESEIERGLDAMIALALSIAEMKKILRDKYGSFVM